MFKMPWSASHVSGTRIVFAFFGTESSVLVANDDRLRLARGDLRVRGLHLGVERVLRHHDDYGHVLIDERERPVLELAGEDALGVHVRDFLDLERTLQARRVPGRDGQDG